MPQTLTDEWKIDLGINYTEIHTRFIHNIGNLTLVAFNSELSNDSFRDKKKIYEENNSLQIAKKMIVENNKWGENEICKRRDWMIDMLINELFPIPCEMKKANNFSQKA